jgi:hypothetical protein
MNKYDTVVDAMTTFRESDPTYFEALALEESSRLEMRKAIAALPLGDQWADPTTTDRYHATRTAYFDAKDATDAVLDSAFTAFLATQ